jgi:hypothetical protein
MTRLRKATIALPLLVVLAGALVPLVVERDSGIRASGTEVPEPVIDGRTSDEWSELAAAALERGRFRQALAHIKTAERLQPGIQYGDRLNEIRSARWRAREIERVRARFQGGPIDGLAFDESGSVTGGHRLVVVLPGESLWSMARSLVAAERGEEPRGVSGRDPAVYAAWDELTSLNGVRELEVGERVAVPVPSAETEALAAVGRADLERLAEARSALSEGRLDDAVAARACIAGPFVPATDACRGLDEEVADALRAREARALADDALAAAREHDFARADSLVLESVALGGDTLLAEEVAALSRERETALIEDARAALNRLGGLPRLSSHRERLELLKGIVDAINEAERLSDGAQYAGALSLADTLIADETRFSIERDGTVVAVKQSGASYTETARAAVEWLLERELVSSGSAYPYAERKTGDETAWARYLVRAADAARAEGIDFAALLTARESELELRLPDPTPFFGD